jgi:hypothetical protein
VLMGQGSAKESGWCDSEVFPMVCCLPGLALLCRYEMTFCIKAT